MILQFIRRKSKLILSIMIASVIIASALTIYIIDNKSGKNSEFNSDLVFLKDKVSSVNYLVGNESTYIKAMNYINMLGNNQLSQKERYTILVDATSNIQALYSATNEPSLYSIIKKDLPFFAKKHFPKLYDGSNFYYSCQDPRCNPSPQPEEILVAISKIDSSSLPENAKKAIKQDLINTGYRDDGDWGKVNQYLIIASGIKSIPSSSSAELLEISRDIQNFVSKEYPNIYETLERTKSSLVSP